jgi:cystathionine gamma-lyase
MHRDTAILHAGYHGVHDPGPFRSGPQFSSTFTTPGEPSDHALTYGRFHNPTWTAWEAALAELEGGECVAFASGMAAVEAVLGVTLKPGDTIVLPSDCYYTIRMLASSWLSTIGVNVRLAATRGNAQAALVEGARVLWLETPTNPQLDVCDIRHLTALAAAHDAITVVDNTTATPYLQRPLALGASIVVTSDTKAMTGHTDLILGHVATNDATCAAALRTWRTQHGAIPGPMEVWLAHRSLATLPLRVSRQCATAQQLATFLASQSRITAVHYPGLPSHPGHDIAARQMDGGFGTVVSFELASRAHAEQFLRSLTLVREATSFGGVHSMAERRARWGGDAIGDGFIRFSVGCEAAEDLIADIAQALGRLV